MLFVYMVWNVDKKTKIVISFSKDEVAIFDYLRKYYGLSSRAELMRFLATQENNKLLKEGSGLEIIESTHN